MYKASGGRRSKVQQRRRISKQQRSRRGDPADDFEEGFVPQRTLSSNPNHKPLFTTEEKRNLMLYSNLHNLPETASSRRHDVEGANGGRRRGRRISRRRR
jgi:hypothetical protein